MKKLTRLRMVAVACTIFLMMNSCRKTEYHIDLPPPPDPSLAGSISFSNYRIDASGSYDETPLGDYKRYASVLEITKLTDTEVDLFCHTEWGETIYALTIPKIPVTGEPYNATLDHISRKGKIRHNDDEYSPAYISIEGSICVPDKIEVRSTPVTFLYECDLELKCMLDGKPLTIVITSAKP